MFKFIFILILLFKITIAKIHLTNHNLDQVCGCKSFETTTIKLWTKKIATIHPSTFNDLTYLDLILFPNNEIEELHPFRV